MFPYTYTHITNVFFKIFSQVGFGTMQCARIFQKLMTRLGHDNFYTQAGDWGSAITTDMAILYPKK